MRKVVAMEKLRFRLIKRKVRGKSINQKMRWDPTSQNTGNKSKNKQMGSNLN